VRAGRPGCGGGRWRKRVLEQPDPAAFVGSVEAMIVTEVPAQFDDLAEVARTRAEILAERCVSLLLPAHRGPSTPPIGR